MEDTAEDLEADPVPAPPLEVESTLPLDLQDVQRRSGVLGRNSLLLVSGLHTHRAHDQTPRTWPFANGLHGSWRKMPLGASSGGAGAGVKALLPLGLPLGLARAQTEQGGGRAGPFLQDGDP